MGEMALGAGVVVSNGGMDCGSFELIVARVAQFRPLSFEQGLFR